MAIRLNIQKFDELAGDPGKWNTEASTFEQGASKVSSIFENNAEILSTMKHFAGSKNISEGLRPLVNSVSELTEETSKYMDSANKWSDSCISMWDQITGGTGASPINAHVSEQAMENVETSYNGNMIGVRSASDVDDFVSRLESNVISPMTQELSQMSSDVQGAHNALPDQIQSAFAATVERNNQAISDITSRMNTLIGEGMEEFKTSLTNWVESSSSAANGG